MKKEINKQRTLKQNSALHIFCQLVADELNLAGLDMPTVLAKSADIPWSKDTVKELIWRPIQKAQLLKQSTTELDTKEPGQVFETTTKFLSEFGVYVPWPSIEEQINKER